VHPVRGADVILADDEARVWWLQTDRPADFHRLAHFATLLSPDEEERRAGYVLDERRRDFALARGFVRTVLAPYVGAPAEALRFANGAHGRPELAAPVRGRLLRFNLTHTRGLLACAVAWDVEVGVDAEHLGRRVNPEAFARVGCAPAEAASLQALPPAERRDRFFALWTLREAYFKARGLGLGAPVDAVSFHVPEHSAISATFADADESSTWQFELARPTPDHCAAIALCVRDGRPRRVRWSDLARQP
jgi:4'-phosphopantetheinyl transferase